MGERWENTGSTVIEPIKFKGDTEVYEIGHPRSDWDDNYHDPSVVGHVD